MTNCYSNPTPIYQPAMRIITSITNANPAIVTTTSDHNYLTGEIIRLIIPEGFGMTQADGLFGEITDTGDTTFTIDIDTTTFDTFAVPSPLPDAYTCAQTIPIGERNSLLSAATKNTLPSRNR